MLHLYTVFLKTMANEYLCMSVFKDFFNTLGSLLLNVAIRITETFRVSYFGQ